MLSLSSIGNWGFHLLLFSWKGGGKERSVGSWLVIPRTTQCVGLMGKHTWTDVSWITSLAGEIRIPCVFSTQESVGKKVTIYKLISLYQMESISILWARCKLKIWILVWVPSSLPMHQAVFKKHYPNIPKEIINCCPWKIVSDMNGCCCC